jgi:hypothetical protein
MKYGNCLIGSLFLLFKERKNNPKFILRYRTGTNFPHFMVKTNNYLHHYKVDKDILPWPLCYIIFQGSYQKVPLSDEYVYNKRGY